MCFDPAIILNTRAQLTLSCIQFHAILSDLLSDLWLDSPLTTVSLCHVTGDVPRVDGQLAVARAFGDKSLKVHLSAQPDIKDIEVDDKTELLILGSDGLWKVSLSKITFLL